MIPFLTMKNGQLFELRIIKPLGIAVNIIFNIARRIKWFFLILGVFLVSFTHSLLYVLHTRRYRKCTEGEACEDNYPTDFFDAFATTYFFMVRKTNHSTTLVAVYKSNLAVTNALDTHHHEDGGLVLLL